MRSWNFSKSLSCVMFFGKGNSVLIPGFASFLLRDANSSVSRLKWGTVTVLPMNLCGSWRTPPGKDRSVNKKDMHHFRGLHKARYLIILHPQALRNAPIDSKFKTKVELMRHTFFLLKVVLFLLFGFLYMNNPRIINISWRVRLQ